MFKKFKNKKGFTLVELIVVIVIILILAALLVPNVVKYVEKANKSACQSNASTVLTEVIAEYTEQAATNQKTGSNSAITLSAVNGYSVSSTGYTSSGTITTRGATYSVSSDQTTIAAFSFCDGRYYVRWTSEGGWSDVEAISKSE